MLMYRLVSAVSFTQTSEAFGAVARFPLDALWRVMRAPTAFAGCHREDRD